MARAFSTGLLLCLGCLPMLCVAPAQSAPPVSQPMSVTIAFPLDAAFRADMRAVTVAFDTSEFQDGLPKKVSYASWATFKRCQDWGGGCQVYTGLHILDILKDWEHPYTPDLSWRYALNTFQDRVEQGVQAGEIKHVNDIPSLLSWIFEQGVAPEGLCRSELDLLTPVVRQPGHALYDPAHPNAIQDYSPGPDATAVAEAQAYRASISQAYTPNVQQLRAMLHRYGPIWSAGCWWWGPCSPTVGGHAMTIIGYDDDKREFTYLNSQGDWWGDDAFGSFSYDDLTAYVESLRIVNNTPTPRLDGARAYSARIRITGVWRGTHTISLGVEGREFLEVWRTHGRSSRAPFEYGNTLEIDVPLPDYAPQCWPPSNTNRWVLRVADNDRDGATGTIREFTLARRLEMPNCLSMGHYRTETYGGTMAVSCQDPTTGPQVPRHRSSDNFFAADWHEPNPSPGVVRVLVPEPGGVPGLVRRIAAEYRVVMRPQDCELGDDNKPILNGQLQSRVLSMQAWQPVPNAKVTIHRLDESGCVNMPARWKLQATRTTDANGRFSYKLKEVPGIVKEYWAAGFKGERDYFLASSEIIQTGLGPENLPTVDRFIEYNRLQFPDLRITLPRLEERMIIMP